MKKRESIGLMQQDAFIFSGTIRDNIMYGRVDATEEEISIGGEEWYI